MWKDKPLIHVEWGMELGAGNVRSTVLIAPDEKRHPNVPLPFWNNTADFKYVLTFIERRNVPRTRFGIEEILKWYGVDFYDPMAMVRKNHGVSMGDFIWILFDDEKPLKYADVSVRKDY